MDELAYQDCEHEILEATKEMTHEQVEAELGRWGNIADDRSLATDEDNEWMTEVVECLGLHNDYLEAVRQICSMWTMALAFKEDEAHMQRCEKEREAFEQRYKVDPVFRAQVDKEHEEKMAAADAKLLREAKRQNIPNTRAFDQRAVAKLLNRIAAHKKSPHRAEALELLRAMRKQ